MSRSAASSRRPLPDPAQWAVPASTRRSVPRPWSSKPGSMSIRSAGGRRVRRLFNALLPIPFATAATRSRGPAGRDSALRLPVVVTVRKGIALSALNDLRNLRLTPRTSGTITSVSELFPKPSSGTTVHAPRPTSPSRLRIRSRHREEPCWTMRSGSARGSKRSAVAMSPLASPSRRSRALGQSDGSSRPVLAAWSERHAAPVHGDSGETTVSRSSRPGRFGGHRARSSATGRRDA